MNDQCYSEKFRMLYSTDASLYQVMSNGVLIPKDVNDMQAAGAYRPRWNDQPARPLRQDSLPRGDQLLGGTSSS